MADTSGLELGGGGGTPQGNPTQGQHTLRHCVKIKTVAILFLILAFSCIVSVLVTLQVHKPVNKYCYPHDGIFYCVKEENQAKKGVQEVRLSIINY